jgi:hypothetical protein
MNGKSRSLAAIDTLYLDRKGLVGEPSQSLSDGHRSHAPPVARDAQGPSDRLLTRSPFLWKNTNLE